MSARIRKPKCKDGITTFYNLDERVMNADLFKGSCDIKVAVILTSGCVIFPTCTHSLLTLRPPFETRNQP